jgi:putative hydrolase of HD superfamily
VSGLSMITKALLETIYDSASMQRWNDKIRPVELRELDKQAHKMIIAYVMGKFEEANENFSWIDIIEGGIFEFLQRLILTDLKPQIFAEIKKDATKYERLNKWVFGQLQPIISCLNSPFCERFQNYFLDTTETLAKKILSAAHFYATKWEFNIIERANPTGYEIPDIKRRIEEQLEKHYDLDGVKQLVMHANLRNFVDLCGELRFQLRWSHIHMTPRCSVLGHMLIVAMLGYLFSLERNACEKRRFNNYFTGLFHDLPEVLTRDIISPVKGAIKGLEDMIKRYEKTQMKEAVYKLIPKNWHPQIKLFTENEFKSVITINGKRVEKSSDEIQKHYNKDRFDPRDGELILAIDHLAAFIEAYLATEKNGIKNAQLEDAKNTFRNRYKDKKSKIAGIDFASMYAEFRS